jgi:hypothetical protein
VVTVTQSGLEIFTTSPAPVARSPFFVAVPDTFHPSLYIDVTQRLRIFCLQALFTNVAATTLTGFMTISTFSPFFSNIFLTLVFHFQHSALSFLTAVSTPFYRTIYFLIDNQRSDPFKKSFLSQISVRLDFATFLAVCILSSTGNFPVGRWFRILERNITLMFKNRACYKCSSQCESKDELS